MLIEFVLAHTRADDERNHPLAPALVGHTDHGDLLNGTVGAEHAFDLRRLDVLSAGDDHVIHPAHHPHIAVFIEPRDVPGVVPAVADRLLVGVGAVPVAIERLVGAHVGDHLSLFTGRHERIRRGVAIRLDETHAGVDRGPPGAAGLGCLIAVDRPRVELSRAVVVEENPRLERLCTALGELLRHRGARVSDAFDRCEVGVAGPLSEQVVK
jgi:hypothetical protein